MTQTVIRPGLGRLPETTDTEFTPNGGRIPRLSGDVRGLIPKLGLREYWYPLCGTGKVSKKKPVRVRIMGEDICLFRGKNNAVHALTDICPHRGARLSEGDCHYEGTVACPYHGWVFDGAGKNVAVLSEGPNSIVCGKPGTEARSFPTQVLKDIVFIWMGDGEPADIREDVPEEFFDPKAYVMFNDRIIWKTNWEVALENSMDSHASFLHRDNLRAVLASKGASSGIGTGMRPYYTGNGFATFFGAPGQRERSGRNREGSDSGFATFPGIGRWPKNRFRSRWSWLFSPLFVLLDIPSGPVEDHMLWGGGHHLPGLYRNFGPSGGNGKNRLKRIFTNNAGLFLSFGGYTRQCVAIDEWETRVWYHHYTLPKNALHKAWIVFNYFTWGRWHCEYNFSQQDMSVMMNQIWDAPEKLSSTDAEVVQWRRLVVTKHFGGRDAVFEYKNPQPGEQFSATPIAAEVTAQ